MAFSRFSDDPCRIEKQLQESTGPGRYMLNVPGNGVNMPFNNDPHMRLQKWGANRSDDIVMIESELFSAKRGANRDYVRDRYDEHYSQKITRNNYPVVHTQTDETRATNPAWTLRDKEQVNVVYLPLNPQENVEMRFSNNINTRNIDRDNYSRTYPVIQDHDQDTHIDIGDRLCTNNKSCGSYG